MELLQDPKEFLGAIYGTLLGDANLDRPKTHGGEGNSRLRFGHSSRDYTAWKASLFNLGEPTFSGKVWTVRSERNPIFSKMYAHMYHSGRKTVTEHVMKVLSPLGLALLYFDDGDLHRDKLDVKIATCGFNAAEHSLLQTGLFKRFGLRFNVHTRRSRIGNKLFYLRLKNSDRLVFFGLIGEYVPSCMQYKIPTAEGLVRILTRSRLSRADVDSILTPEVLRNLYVDKRYSIYKMSQVLGINSGTILGRLRKLGVNIRNEGKYSPSMI